MIIKIDPSNTGKTQQTQNIVDPNQLMNLKIDNDFYEAAYSPDWCIGTCQLTKIA